MVVDNERPPVEAIIYKDMIPLLAQLSSCAPDDPRAPLSGALIRSG